MSPRRVLFGGAEDQRGRTVLFPDKTEEEKKKPKQRTKKKPSLFGRQEEPTEEEKQQEKQARKQAGYLKAAQTNLAKLEKEAAASGMSPEEIQLVEEGGISPLDWLFGHASGLFENPVAKRVMQGHASGLYRAQSKVSGAAKAGKTGEAILRTVFPFAQLPEYLSGYVNPQYGESVSRAWREADSSLDKRIGTIPIFGIPVSTYGVAGAIAEGATDPMMGLHLGSGFRQAATKLTAAGKVSKVAKLTRAGVIAESAERLKAQPEAVRRATYELLAKSDLRVMGQVQKGDQVLKQISRVVGQAVEPRLGKPMDLHALETALSKGGAASRWLDPAEATRNALKIKSLADDIATDLAGDRTIRMAEKMARRGMKQELIDKGGVKFFETRILPLALTEPITNLTAQASRRIGRLPTIKAAARAWDWTFHRELRPLRDLPGGQEAFRLYHARRAYLGRDTEQFLHDLTKSWGRQTVNVEGLDKAKLFTGKSAMRVWDYVSLAADDPANFPINRLPAEIQSQMPTIKRWLAETWERESIYGVAKGRIKNYFPHHWHNQDEAEKLATQVRAHIPGQEFTRGTMRFPYNEVRAFPTFSSAMEAAKRNGFKLKPVLDFHEAMSLRMKAHNTYRAMYDELAPRLKARYGSTAEQAAAAKLSKVFPAATRDLDELASKAPATVERKVMAKKTLPSGQQVSLLHRTEMVKVADMLDSFASGKRPFRSAEGLSPEGKAVYHVGALKSIFQRPQPPEKIIKAFSAHIHNPKVQKALAELDGEAVNRLFLDLENIDTMLAKDRYFGDMIEVTNKLGSPKQLAPFMGWRMPESVVKQLQRLDTTVLNREEIAAIKLATTLTNYFKQSVTVLFPSFHFRNHYSNLLQNYVTVGLASFDPAIGGAAAASLMAHKFPKLYGLGFQSPGRRYTLQEGLSLFEFHGLRTGRHDITEVATGMAGRTSKSRFRSVLRAPVGLGSGVGQYVEDYAKLVNFYWHLQQGFAPRHAASMVRQTLFDYNDLSPIERDVFRLVLPFYTWTRKNLGLQMTGIKNAPGRVLIPLKFHDRMSGPDAAMLPDYLHGAFRVKVKEDEKGVAYLTGIDFPITSAINTIFDEKGKFNPARALVLMSNPILQSTFQAGTGVDPFYGDDRAEAVNNVVGQVIEKVPGLSDWLEVTKLPNGSYTMNPVKSRIFFSFAGLSRVLSTSDRFERIMENDGLALATFNAITGFSYREYDLSDSQKRMLYNRLNRLSTYLKKKGLIREGSYYYAPK